MLRRVRISLCSVASGVYRELDAGELLSVIQSDGGETATYYATRYFGPKSKRRVEHLLWHDLKKNGHVDLQRGSDLSAVPRWHSVSGPRFRAPRVMRHREEDHDLSVLEMEVSLGKQQESDIVSQLQSASPPAASTRAFATRPAENDEWKAELDRLSKAARRESDQP
uniref:Uncharacterized protein n=1 Tax=Neobodo designis TaxID=312471 RepID=A0A7S1MGG9_NEODS|mmetsp:Transcript_40057/g.123762  ORF Transcript_40057/g.123762 Transcript_40057/m.123762 type:complete len:167 (+) Transcript_40057:29-529(+)